MKCEHYWQDGLTRYSQDVIMRIDVKMEVGTYVPLYSNLR